MLICVEGRMTQLFIVFIVFLMIPLLSRFKIQLSYILLIACCILALLSGMGAEAALQSVKILLRNFHQ